MENLIISEILTEDEKPVIVMKSSIIAPKKSDSGPAFHEKSKKNSKVKVEKRYISELKAKYKKPISKGSKKKGA